MEITKFLKIYGWLDVERTQARVEDLRLFLKTHNAKVSGKRSELVYLVQFLLKEKGWDSDYWLKKP